MQDREQPKSARPSETADAIHRLKEEINRLTKEQDEDLKMAVDVGMTPDEAKEYDERKQRILAYVQQLAILTESL